MIKLFVGCSPNGEDAESQAVLEYTLKKHSSVPVQIEWMKISENKENFWGGWDSSGWSTPFSAFRFGIPAFCNFEGKAIYCDSDFIFRDDIAKLWNQEFQPNKLIMAKGGKEGWRTCLMVWNNELAKNVLPPLDQIKLNTSLYRNLINVVTQNQWVQQFDGNWNCVDLEDYENINDENIKTIHYSSMQHQPHIKYALERLNKINKNHWFDGEIKEHWRKDLIQLFDEELKNAIDNGYLIENYINNGNWIDYKKESQANYNNAHSWINNKC